MGCHFGMRFPKCRRLRKRREFLEVQRRGHKVHSRAFVGLMVNRNEGFATTDQEATARIGITTTKRMGNAVTRNRIRRLVREAFRQGLFNIPSQLDFVVIAKKSAAALDTASIFEDLRRLGREAQRGTEQLS